MDGLIWFDPPISLPVEQRHALEVAREYVRVNFPKETSYKRYGGLIERETSKCNCWVIQFTPPTAPPRDPHPIYSDLEIFVDKMTFRVVAVEIAQ